MTNRTNDPAGVDDLVRSAGDRGRVTFDAPTASADVPAEDLTPAPIDLDDDALDALLRDKATRREVLADPAVKVRLAKQVPQFAAEIDAWNARALAAEERADAAVAAAAGPRPQPLPGGGAAPIPPSPPSPESILRAAASAARGEPIDHAMRPFVRPASDVTVAGFTPR